MNYLLLMEYLCYLLNFSHSIATNSKDVGMWSVTQNESLNFAPPDQVEESMETDDDDTEEPSENKSPSPPPKQASRRPPPAKVQPRRGLAAMPVLQPFVI